MCTFRALLNPAKIHDPLVFFFMILGIFLSNLFNVNVTLSLLQFNVILDIK